MAAAETARQHRELVGKGQRHLKEAITVAFQILTSINNEFSDPALWSTSHHQEQDPPAAAGSDAASGAAGGGGRGASPSHGGPLDEARHRYKTAMAALWVSIATVSCCAQEIGPTEDKANTVEIKRLEDRASLLRKEIESKNKDVKCLVDHLRDLISDVSMLQSSSVNCYV
ncbi:hypothetical protein E2562_028337 [Oryza meyeriana var. granulata]|uniref:Mediator of RNA polymerase II transcription subunit 30 n=1 Tax=Oryza meyeriana var. granulata TaxID=110450 RepID=A0A6G1FCT0_9ORYZ|nr:hypothetical protein E2562_028337 [Oryza meyeriana var. granulata]